MAFRSLQSKALALTVVTVVVGVSILANTSSASAATTLTRTKSCFSADGLYRADVKATYYRDLTKHKVSVNSMTVQRIVRNDRNVLILDGQMYTRLGYQSSGAIHVEGLNGKSRYSWSESWAPRWLSAGDYPVVAQFSLYTPARSSLGCNIFISA